MNKRVLVPTDFSQNALNALRYAMQLYHNVPTDFYLMNAFQVQGYALESMLVPEPGETRYETAKAESEAGIDRLTEILELYPENDKHRFHTISTFNSLLTATQYYIDKKDIDIVVMGTKGFTDSANIVLGTNAVDLMEKITECPVLAVPKDVRFQPPKKIVFPTNFKISFKRKELGVLFEIAKLHNARLTILHVTKKASLNKRQEENKVLLEDMLTDFLYDMQTLESSDKNEAIIDFIEDQQTDMLAFLNKKHWFFGSLLTNPLVKEAGYSAIMPMLALNDNS